MAYGVSPMAIGIEYVTAGVGEVMSALACMCVCVRLCAICNALVCLCVHGYSIGRFVFVCAPVWLAAWCLVPLWCSGLPWCCECRVFLFLEFIHVCARTSCAVVGRGSQVPYNGYIALVTPNISKLNFINWKFRVGLLLKPALVNWTLLHGVCVGLFIHTDSKSWSKLIKFYCVVYSSPYLPRFAFAWIKLIKSNPISPWKSDSFRWSRNPISNLKIQRRVKICHSCERRSSGFLRPRAKLSSIK
jgi:hypothetical protein